MRLDTAARQYIQAVHNGTYHAFEPAQLGFEFSLGEIEVRAMQIDPKLFADYEQRLRQKYSKRVA